MSPRCEHLAPQQIPGDEEYICRSFRQAAHEIGIPLGTEWNVNAHAPSFAHQPPLQVAANAVEHLKLKGVAWNIFLRGKCFGLIDDLLVVRRQAVIDAALHQNFHQPDVARVHF